MKASAEVLHLATGAPTSIVGLSDLSEAERARREADHDTRTKVLRGLRALFEWQQQKGL